ncbi:MAG: RecX family transcriptional regulator, partial [Chloroflexota bacterium]|nr:RecX family transcriptional regulator [Chloroflexota bacterium]
SFQKAHDRALHFLSYRPRSEAEIQRYLRDKGVPKPIEEEIIQRLKAVGLLDDLAFARYWVEDRERFKPRSARMLRYELRRKGVSDEIIAKALEDLDEEESAYRAAGHRAHRLLNLDYKSFRRRLGAYLRRRGFSYEVARNASERLWRELGTADDADTTDYTDTANPR